MVRSLLVLMRKRYHAYFALSSLFLAVFTNSVPRQSRRRDDCPNGTGGELQRPWRQQPQPNRVTTLFRSQSQPLKPVRRNQWPPSCCHLSFSRTTIQMLCTKSQFDQSQQCDLVAIARYNRHGSVAHLVTSGATLPWRTSDKVGVIQVIQKG